MNRPGVGAALCILGLLVVASVPRWTYAVPYGGVVASEAEGPPVAWAVADAGGMVANPHSDLIFEPRVPPPAWIVIARARTGRSVRRCSTTHWSKNSKPRPRAFMVRAICRLSAVPCRGQQGRGKVPEVSQGANGLWSMMSCVEAFTLSHMRSALLLFRASEI